jgi:hypothetical protein
LDRRSELAWRIVVTTCALAVAACGDEPATVVEEAPPIACLPAPADHLQDDALRVNHLQAKATHNSYHLEPEGNTIDDLGYSHLPLDRQLDEQGVRHVELDVRFSHELGVFEVYHLPVVDEDTTCRLLTGCLAVVKRWSDEHCGHHPVVVQIELKDGQPVDVERYFATLHESLLSVWPLERIITPMRVQGDHASLADALRDEGWPVLGEVRGKVLFMLDNASAFQQAYTHERTDLDERLIFAHGTPGQPFAAVAVLNDPVGDATAIADALAAGMLVRTRADSGSVEPLAEDFTRQQTALDSGAHFVTTDYPAPVDYTSYWLDIPGGTPSRCNPVTSPAGCEATAIEDPLLLAQ